MLNKIKKITIRDMLGFSKFLLVLIPSLIFGAFLRLTKQNLWLICEREDMARDNGLAFFEYMQKEHPEIKTYYAIDKQKTDYKYVKNYRNNVVQWASLKHYFLYMSATRNISSHKEGNPNQTLFTILHLYLNLYNNRVFLQHGITLNDLKMFYYKKTKFRTFICGAKPEYDYIKKHFGYPEKNVVYTGFARFDKLVDRQGSKIIVFMPTWRRWLNESNIYTSAYRSSILDLLNDKALSKYLESNQIKMLFYPHINAQSFFNKKDIKNKNVKLIKANDVSVNDLLCKASLLITDYSSVALDFSYMGKPTIYYQPDEADFRRMHAREGFFEYRVNGFGPVVSNTEQLLAALCNKNKAYEERVGAFFEKRDYENRKRIYEEIVKK